MQFSVIFANPAACELSGTTKAQVGLRRIGIIQDYTGCLDLSLELIQGNIYPVICRDVQVHITKQEAQSAGELFLDAFEITVTVQKGSLNSFFFLDVVTEVNSADNQIRNARMEWAINKKQLYAAWAEAGFPTDWNPKNEIAGGIKEFDRWGFPTQGTPED